MVNPSGLSTGSKLLGPFPSLSSCVHSTNFYVSTLFSTRNKKVNVAKSLPSRTYSLGSGKRKTQYISGVSGQECGQGDPLDMGNEKKSNSKHVSFLLEALIKDKLELENCQMRLLHIYLVLDFIPGWP